MTLPGRIAGLRDLAANLAWSWHRGARALFAAIDAPLWDRTRHNPVALLRQADPARLEACAHDPAFLQSYDAVRAAWDRALSAPDTWFSRAYPHGDGAPIAYFCAEFGLHSSVPIYAGGLGVLAGDHCKAASHLGVPLIAVGLLYRKGYFDQRVRPDGWQEADDDTLDPALAPLECVRGPDGRVGLATVRLGGRPVQVGAWLLRVGRVVAYLLDTDLAENDPADRALSHHLYGSGPPPDLRIRQELLLGLGGVRVLRALGVTPAAWHANEGHAAFMMIERVRELTAHGTPFEEAQRQVRARSVFTTHTPVAAGHDIFAPELLERVAGPVWEELGIPRPAFLHLGDHPDHGNGLFHMTAAAIRLSAWVNGVTQRHQEVTRRMWQHLWPARDLAQVPIGHVTNGVHVATWMAPRLQDLLTEHLGAEWARLLEETSNWDRVLELDDARLWEVRAHLKSRLLDFLRDETRARVAHPGLEAGQVVAAGPLFTADVMLIGFARRFATYKRADLIFRDVERLTRLVTDARRPVQIVFAGKAHPADEPGKALLQRVYAFARDPRFNSRIAFLEDYDLHVAARLVQGVDLWLNLPRPPLEACGTSGMKAALNAVPQLSTLDGWWAEGYTGMNGWALPGIEAGHDVDAVDAGRLYALLEEEVVPMFYDRDARGIPRAWMQRSKHALHVAVARFSARRMVREYASRYYVP
ncbi:MAG: alpha-glucan family phosphorylase, partial [Gemmatimonadales bacterium]